ncbi:MULTISPECIES: helix-turn-helix transcriptional regulator [unclassified Ralstonia]|uniref:helix-turn-helix transcriptional regulator n=2 Tax=unclassified Ralstonia TaxID=209769 RepID=UPI0038921ED9
MGRLPQPRDVKQMQMKPNIAETDFRSAFAHFDPTALITPAEFADLLGISPNALYHRSGLGELPQPAIRKHRCVRWRVSDVREWLKRLSPKEDSSAEGQHPRGPRRGRRRHAVEMA